MDKYHADKGLLMVSYIKKIAGLADSYLVDNIPEQKIDEIMQKYDVKIDKLSIIGFVDTSLNNDDLAGILFTDDQIYYFNQKEKIKNEFYSKIKKANILLDMDEMLVLKITGEKGKNIYIRDSAVNKQALKDFLCIMQEYFKITKKTKTRNTTTVKQKHVIEIDKEKDVYKEREARETDVSENTDSYKKSVDEENIKVEKIPLNIGVASVNAKTKGKMFICIQNTSGKIYEFETQGNAIQSFDVNGRIYNYGE